MGRRSHSKFGITWLTALVSVLASLSLTGCATRLPVPSKVLAASTLTSTAQAPPPLAHSSRYTLAEMSPEVAQTDLLQQIVDIRIPATATSSVGDTLRYILLHSGYRLCEDPAIRDFDAFPLPAAHMHLGPLPLASALQVLVGRAWALEVDESGRRVCFSRENAGSSYHKTIHSKHAPHAGAGTPNVLAAGEPE